MPDDNESESRIGYSAKVFTAFNHLAEGMKLFVEQQLRQAFSTAWQDNICHVEGHSANLADPYVLLATMKNRWDRAFEPRFKGVVSRRVIDELYETRNATYHSEPFTAEKVDNSVSSMLLLLKNIPESEASRKAAECIEKLRHQPIHTDNLAPVAEAVVNAAVEEHAVTPQTQANANLVKTELAVDDNQSDEHLPVENDQPAELLSSIPITSGSQNTPTVTYNFSRLCFKASQIEPLQDDQVFRVVTPVGTFQMTKSEFHRAFPKVIVSKSYSEKGIYHYPSVPKSALPYKLPE